MLVLSDWRSTHRANPMDDGRARAYDARAPWFCAYLARPGLVARNVVRVRMRATAEAQVFASDAVATLRASSADGDAGLALCVDGYYATHTDELRSATMQNGTAHVLDVRPGRRTLTLVDAGEARATLEVTIAVAPGAVVRPLSIATDADAMARAVVDGYGLYGFDPRRGIPGVRPGLKWIHSPFYDGGWKASYPVTLPGPMFAAGRTEFACPADRRAHCDWLTNLFHLTLHLYQVTPADFEREASAALGRDRMDWRTLRPFCVLADVLSLFSRTSPYMFDHARTPGGMRPVERFMVPLNGGDCEDMAKMSMVVYHDLALFADLGGARRALHRLASLFVPIMQQGLVTLPAASAHGAPRPTNHIWFSLLPRSLFLDALLRPDELGGPPGLAALAATADERALMRRVLHRTERETHPIEAHLPPLLCEGTGHVFPCQCFGLELVGRSAMRDLRAVLALRGQAERSAPELARMGTAHFQTFAQRPAATGAFSDFYSVAITCVTDVFADHGLRAYDFAIVSEPRTPRYGAPFGHWVDRARWATMGLVLGNRLAPAVLDDARALMALERPILPRRLGGPPAAPPARTSAHLCPTVDFIGCSCGPETAARVEAIRTKLRGAGVETTRLDAPFDEGRAFHLLRIAVPPTNRLRY